ncbi:MAG: hypothetical protein U0457_02895 [Candidatus Sericytochromatia bacterium]
MKNNRSNRKYFKAPISWYKIDSGTATIRIEKIDDNNAQIVFESNLILLLLM